MRAEHGFSTHEFLVLSLEGLANDVVVEDIVLVGLQGTNSRRNIEILAEDAL